MYLSDDCEEVKMVEVVELKLSSFFCFVITILFVLFYFILWRMQLTSCIWQVKIIVYLVLQEDNGIPIHLKGGATDAILYRTTMALTIMGEW